MRTLLDFFQGIADVITGVVSFVISLFKDLISMIMMLWDVVANIPAYFSWLPGEIIALLVALISVVVMYKILGREG